MAGIIRQSLNLKLYPLNHSQFIIYINPEIFLQKIIDKKDLIYVGHVHNSR